MKDNLGREFIDNWPICTHDCSVGDCSTFIQAQCSTCGLAIIPGHVMPKDPHSICYCSDCDVIFGYCPTDDMDAEIEFILATAPMMDTNK